VAIAAAGDRLYVVVRGDKPGVLTLDADTGQRLAFAALQSQPGDAVLDPATGWLAVALPDRDALETIDPTTANVTHEISGLRHVTGLALDPESDTLYVTQLEGDLSAVDLRSGTIAATLHLTDIGLSGVAAAHGHVYAINTPGEELISVDPSDMSVAAWSLGVEPGAVAVDPGSGAVAVLTSDAAGLMRVDPTSGTTLGEVALGAGGAPASLEPNKLWQRPRIAVGAEVYVIAPQSTTLAIAPTSY
jgi:DNA-binding beta-propeller fold protein YncE